MDGACAAPSGLHSCSLHGLPGCCCRAAAASCCLAAGCEEHVSRNIAAAAAAAVAGLAAWQPLLAATVARRRPPHPSVAAPALLCVLCLLQVPAAAAQTYAKDDFFDQLSCDTLERLQVTDEGGGCCTQFKWLCRSVVVLGAARMRAVVGGARMRMRACGAAACTRLPEGAAWFQSRGIIIVNASSSWLRAVRALVTPPCPLLLLLPGAGERGDWRSKMAAQRKVDQETFGGMARSNAGAQTVQCSAVQCSTNVVWILLGSGCLEGGERAPRGLLAGELGVGMRSRCPPSSAC